MFAPTFYAESFSLLLIFIADALAQINIYLRTSVLVFTAGCGQHTTDCCEEPWGKPMPSLCLAVNVFRLRWWWWVYLYENLRWLWRNTFMIWKLYALYVCVHRTYVCISMVLWTKISRNNTYATWRNSSKYCLSYINYVVSDHDLCNPNFRHK